MEQGKKRVLMFCVSFFGYEKRIADAIRSEGYEVDFYDERPNNGVIAKTCIRYNAKFYRPMIRRHIERVIHENKDKNYDYVIVVKGEGVNEEAVDLLRKAYPQAEFVLYLWDSVVNIPDCEKRMKKYDRVLTFDPQDAKKYSLKLLLIPYDKKSFNYQSGDEYRYDVAFIGTAHSVRPRVVKQVAALCEQQGKKVYKYFYSPHILVYLFNKLTNPDYRWISLKEINFKALSSDQVHEIYRASRCVMDIEHPKQDGATTRPVEMLPMRKKIITTNRQVQEYPFFDRNNFCVIDRDKPEIPGDFWDVPYVPVDDSVMERYSPEQFVRTLLHEKND